MLARSKGTSSPFSRAEGMRWKSPTILSTWAWGHRQMEHRWGEVCYQPVCQHVPQANANHSDMTLTATVPALQAKAASRPWWLNIPRQLQLGSWNGGKLLHRSIESSTRFCKVCGFATPLGGHAGTSVPAPARACGAGCWHRFCPSTSPRPHFAEGVIWS